MSDDAPERAPEAAQPRRVVMDAATALARAQALLRAGQTRNAVKVINALLRADPNDARGHNWLGMARVTGNDLEGAVRCYEQAIRLDPSYAEAYNNLGNVLRHQERWGRAVACYRKVVELSSDSAVAHNNLGMALLGRGQRAEAAAAFRRACDLDRDNPRILRNLGDALRDSGAPEEAITHYERALALGPDDVFLHNRIGMALEALGRMDEALARYQRAIDARDDKAAAYCDLGLIHHEAGRFDDAVACYRQALAIDPDHAASHNNLANTHLKSGDVAAAVAAYRKAIALQPDNVGGHVNHALALLTLGDYEDGWVEHEWRWKQGRHAVLRARFPGPFWDGSPLNGRTIVLYSEQGRGDTIQFIRYAPIVAAMGGRVVVECYADVLDLFRGVAGIERLVRRGDPLPPYDVHAPLLSLPLILGTRLETIPADAGYIRADAARVEAWRGRMAALAAPRIGLCWQGNPRYGGDKWRSVPLRHFAPLFADPRITFVSLHKGTGEAQIAECGLEGRLADFGADIESFADTAAIMENLDLIITSDTSVAHLAGALGLPAWVLLAAGADWRWFVDREDSPWYPTLRLFRQRTRGDWDQVVARVKAALDERFALS